MTPAHRLILPCLALIAAACFTDDPPHATRSPKPPPQTVAEQYLTHAHAGFSGDAMVKAELMTTSDLQDFSGDQLDKRGLQTLAALGSPHRPYQLRSFWAYNWATRSSGTAFYLGSYAGLSLVAVNYHVGVETKEDGSSADELAQAEDYCASLTTNFVSLKEIAGHTDPIATRFLVGAWKEIDFLVCAVEVTEPLLAARLAEAPIAFDFSGPLRWGQPLFVVSFRHEFYQEIDDSSECQVLADPLPPYRSIRDNRPTVGLGCESKMGDSGAAVTDLATNKVVGFLTQGSEWRGPFSFARLAELAQAEPATIARDLTRMVPLQAINEYLRAEIAAGRVAAASVPALEGWLNGQEK